MNEMNITSAKYKTSNKENDSIIVVADGQTLYVPIAPGNRHYQAVLEWAAIDGNTIAEAD
tara:strand:- start:45 stop:224 length:180 start_codon:yes stop_codon:yes gene_type:complete